MEREYTKRYVARRSYHEALTIYTALWRHARLLNRDFPADWRHDVEADIELARVLHGLPS